MLPHELPRVGRQLVQTDAEHRGQAQIPRHCFAHLAEARVEIPHDGKYFPGRTKKDPAFRRERKVSFAALDEARAETLLQGLDLLAHRALRHRIEPRGLRKTGGFGQIAEYFEKKQLHCDYEQD